MGKRSNFVRRKQDQYFTPEKPVLALIPHLPKEFTFCEPCAGDGRLIRHLEKLTGGQCLASQDIDPKDPSILQADAMDIVDTAVDFFITNPPWTRSILHEMILHLSKIKPTWFLFDADWMFTAQAAPFLPLLQKTVAVGRVSWMENGVSGLDNAAWYLFDANNDQQTQFFGKVAA